jgi:hypothetical protein
MRDTLLHLWRELVHRSRPLAYLGLVHWVLFIVLFALAAIDDRQITGLNRWIKPMKFSASVGLYLWTIAWFLGYLKRTPNSVKIVGWSITFCMAVEMICVVTQAARGTISHFNTSPGVDGAVFSLMGILIVLNTLLVMYVLALFCLTHVELAPAYLWGIRLGMLVFLVSSLEGFAMTGQKAHTVGQPDGGPGLPVLNWSTQAGDLRVAHFIGLHALQLIPLVGFFLSKRHATPLLPPAGWTIVVTLSYSLVVAALYLQAIHGQPFIGMERASIP